MRALHQLGTLVEASVLGRDDTEAECCGKYGKRGDGRGAPCGRA